MANFRKKLRLGDVLINKGYIDDEQLKKALKKQKTTNTLLGETLVDMGYVSQEILIDVLCDQLQIDYVDLRTTRINENAVHLVTEEIVRKYKIIPIEISSTEANLLKVAMADPMDILAIDDIGIITGMQIEPVLSTGEQILNQIDKYFGKQKANAIAEQFKKEQKEYFNTETSEEDVLRKENVENSPIVQLVRNLIEQAVRQRASDIHIEPFEHFVKVRYRVDGMLREVITYDRAIFSAIIARLKIISGMDISEKRKPQDGRITIEVDKKEYDIRVSSLPTVFGEKVVMRLASKEGFKKDKKELGLRPEDLEKFDKILKNPHGIILVTGPTGSGKSTTLYTALSELNSDDVNIITVEDPVEANVDGVNQVQVNLKADLTFASALRSILRQDPDIIMIGEIRDSETAEIAVKASITGHLVVSTLHTNSTAGTIARLEDMGVEPYLLGDSIVGIIAQRLVRCLCDKCKTKRLATEREKSILKTEGEEVYIYDPCGCEICGNTGYLNRIGVYEIMNISSRIKTLIGEGKSADEIKRQAEAEGMSSLRASSAKYVLEGKTSIEEMVKIAYNADED